MDITKDDKNPFIHLGCIVSAYDFAKVVQNWLKIENYWKF